MKKLTIAIGLYISMLGGAKAQEKSLYYNPNYQNRTLKLEEVNLVSSYYHQNGNNSAVTGGIGTEQLTDFGNTIDLKWSMSDKKQRKHSFTFDLGIDAYSSASSDKINPNPLTSSVLSGASSSSGGSKGGKGGTTTTSTRVISLTSASYRDTRVYPTVGWSVKDDRTGLSLGASLSASTEYDYKSLGGSLNIGKASRDNNRELSLKVNAFFDKWAVILPVELRPTGYGSGAESDPNPIDHKPRNSYSAALTFSQVVNSRMQVALIVEPSYQEGLLSTQYHRVYFSNGTEGLEKLPDKRSKLPIGMRANYFLGDRFIIRSFYRYYQDDWGLKAHTASLETSIRLSPFVAVSPFYRFHTQQGISYFAPYQQNLATSQYHTSDYDLSTLQTHFIGTGLRLASIDGVLGMKHFNSLEIRFGHYLRSTGLEANSITLAAKFK
ncbi:MAG: DUF3570 domain-containing protein [Spirosomataceae bacterium]